MVIGGVGLGSNGGGWETRGEKLVACGGGSCLGGLVVGGLTYGGGGD